MEDAKDYMLTRIQNFCKRTGYEVGSHVYHAGLFLVSAETPSRGRIWRVAQINLKTKKVEVVEGAESPLLTGAKAMLQRTMAEKGVSPYGGATFKLKDVPTFPRWGVL
jgi:hypothetical protein